MSQDFDSLVQAYLQELYEESPVTASDLGVEGYDDRLADHSAEAYQRREAREDHWLAVFGRVPDAGLTPEQRLDRDLVTAMLRGAVVMRDWQGWRRDPSQYLNECLYGVLTLFIHRLHPEPDLARFARARLLQVPRVLEQGKANLAPELTNPLFVERALGSCRAGVAYARHLVPAEVADPTLRQEVAEAGEVAARALEGFAAWLEELRAAACGHWAIGEERYSGLLRERELLGYGARELRERGWEAYAELEAEMRRLAREVGGTGDWRQVVEELNRDCPRTPEEMRDLYAEWTERARDFCYGHGLVSQPPGERCVVEPSPPFQRPILAVASYWPPPALRPAMTGHFFVPYPPDGASEEDVRKLLEDNNRHNVPTTSVHEAYPGHHWHLVWVKTRLRPLRAVHWSSYFLEGWALYAEKMMREQGFFADPRHELYHVEARLFRAARIVVDTSLHLGEMGFEEAVAFMEERAGRTPPVARAEVGRYCTWPTQAASYLTGSLEIERMRERYLREGRGDLRSFHDTVAGSGGLPLGLAERAVLG